MTIDPGRHLGPFAAWQVRLTLRRTSLSTACAGIYSRAQLGKAWQRGR